MEKKINKWKASGKVSKIIKVLKDNNYKNRQFALVALGELKDTSTIDSIKPLIYDPVKLVVQAAVEALQQFDLSDEIKKEIYERLLEIKTEEEVRATKREENKQKAESANEDYLERKMKEMKLREVENEAKKVQRGNEKQKRLTDTLDKIIGDPK